MSRKRGSAPEAPPPLDHNTLSDDAALGKMSKAELVQYCRDLRYLLVEVIARAQDINENLSARQRRTDNENEYLKRKLSRDRWAERDDRIINLRDRPRGKRLSFQQIGKMLAVANPKWVGRDGRPLDRKAVEKAYKRRKREHRRQAAGRWLRDWKPDK